MTLVRVLVPCCREVAAGALCRGGRVCAGGIAGNVEAEASRRDGQLRHHTSQHGVSRTGSSRVTQTRLPQGQRVGRQRSVSIKPCVLNKAEVTWHCSTVHAGRQRFGFLSPGKCKQ